MKKITGTIFSISALIVIILSIPVLSEEDIEFILPEHGGGMVHSDPQMSDYINLPVPEKNVEKIWQCNDLSGEKAGAKGNGISGNGKIAACTFSGKKDNLVVYNYDGERLWSSGDLLNSYALFSTPMIDVHNRVIACDNRVILLVDPLDFDNDKVLVEWISGFPHGGLPFSPVILEDGTIIVATNNGPVYAFDSKDGSLVAWTYLGKNEINSLLSRLLKKESSGFFSTINTPCVNGDRIYISTQYKQSNGVPQLLHNARLYAIDVDVTNPDMRSRLKTAWYYEFGGPSQASPLFINDTIYFDGYRSEPSLLRDVHLFAVEDKGNVGVEKWKVSYPFQTYASFSYDPRGGFWYVDPLGGKITRFSTDDGRIIDEIIIDDLVNEEGQHLPSSVMTICGNYTNPVLVMSAVALRPFKANSYIIAIDLAESNSLMWKVKIYSGNILNINLGWGQYTILMKEGQPRVVFGSFSEGVWAVGDVNFK